MITSQELLKRYNTRLTIEAQARLKPHEWMMIEWLLEKLPFTVIVRKASEIPGEKSADILLDNALFEMKWTSGTLNTLDKHIRHAIRQSGGRGAIINIDNVTYTNTEAILTLMARMNRSGLDEAYLLHSLKLIAHMRWSNGNLVIKSYPQKRQQGAL